VTDLIDVKKKKKNTNVLYEIVKFFCLHPKGLAQVVEALVLRFALFKVKGSTLYECKQSLGATPLD
jgi:hypothetical protein